MVPVDPGEAAFLLAQAEATSASAIIDATNSFRLRPPMLQPPSRLGPCTNLAFAQTGPLNKPGRWTTKTNENLIRDEPEYSEQGSGGRWVPAGSVVNMAGTSAQPKVAPGYLSRRASRTVVMPKMHPRTTVKRSRLRSTAEDPARPPPRPACRRMNSTSVPPTRT